MMNTTSSIGRQNEKTALAVFLCIVYSAAVVRDYRTTEILTNIARGGGEIDQKNADYPRNYPRSHPRNYPEVDHKRPATDDLNVV